MLSQNFQILAVPDARHTLAVHAPSVGSQWPVDPLVALAAIAGCRLGDDTEQRLLILRASGLAAPGRTILLQQTAGPAFRYAGLADDMLNEGAFARGLYHFPAAAFFRISLSSSAFANKRFRRAFLPPPVCSTLWRARRG
ncbi:MAG: hypothetical protein C0456_16405, partial [Hyphomonas sp.]|nr:hypothetical protein [Hyphomonas sp.]